VSINGRKENSMRKIPKTISEKEFSETLISLKNYVLMLSRNGIFL